MTARRNLKKRTVAHSGRNRLNATASRSVKSDGSTDYQQVLADTIRLIQESRRRALVAVNCELVCLYWHIGRIIVRQQDEAQWGDGVVEQFAADLRLAFPDMRGVSRDNVFRMRQFFRSCTEIDCWLAEDGPSHKKVGSAPRLLGQGGPQDKKVGPASRLLDRVRPDREKVGTASRLSADVSGAAAISPGTLEGIEGLRSVELTATILSLSWSHHYVLTGAVDTPAEKYFYMRMALRERWSVRELRRQIDADLFTRYVSVKKHPEKCLPEKAESDVLLPFKDHYVLEFLGLEEEHSELQLRKAILSNLRDFFLEFGKDLTFVGEEYPLTVGGDTFYIDLLFFHRRLQCLIAIELKKGKFKPEFAGKSRFYCAALDELIKLPHESASLGLVLCRSADSVQVRLALTDAAEKIGVATYQTALPDERLIRRRIEQLPDLPEEDA